MNRIIQKSLAGGVIIQGCMIAGTSYAVFSAYKPIESPMNSDASTITTINGKWHGRIGSDPDQDRFKHLKVGTDARSKAVADAYAERYASAVRLIKAAFPQFDDPTYQADHSLREEAGRIAIVISDLDLL